MKRQFYDETVNFFQSLPPDNTREYEKSISAYALKHRDEESLAVFRQMMQSGESCAYSAFYCLATILRHNKDYSILWEAINEAKKYPGFQERVSFRHIEIMFHVHSESLYDYNEILSDAHHQACEEFNNPGYQHTFANAFATICEKCLKEDEEKIVAMWYDSALFCVNRAIELDPAYAKFYSTKARIVVLKEHFDEANDLIIRAIDLEKSEKSDYALLIGNYQYYRAMISIRRQQYMIQQKMDSPRQTERDESIKISHFHSMEPFAFISYAHADAERVYPSIEKLCEHHLNVWYDREIGSGEDWQEKIATHIKNCSVLVLMLSSTSVLSQNVRNELTMAQNYKKVIIPVFLEMVHLSPGAELQLQTYHWLKKYLLSPSAYYQELISAVAREVNQPVTYASRKIPAEKQKPAEKYVAAGKNGIIEQFIQAKSGREETNEDLIYIDENFYAVFDGATSKSGICYQGKTEGQLAVACLADAMRSNGFGRMIDGRTAVAIMQDRLCAYRNENGLADKGMHLCASGVIYSKARRQIWAVGDCQYMINGKVYSQGKRVDQLMSEVRSYIIHCLLLEGMTEEDLMQKDVARGLILDILKRQYHMENATDPYGYSVFSGEGKLLNVEIRDVPPGAEIVLASDGYPLLMKTLAESEEKLQELIRTDPLCYKEYKSTKGLLQGNISFDDRAYLRFDTD